jgi:hypothetical protein
MYFKRFIVLACSLLLLCACATKSSSTKTGNNNISESISKIINGKHERADELLAFIESYSNMAPDSQKKAFANTNQALTESKNNLSQRAKLAIMLALPTSRFRDSAKAQALLQDLLREENLEPQENALLGLLYEYALEDSKQLQKNREDAKKLESAQQKYEALQQKYDGLEQKLNDLKNIEKTMNERSTKTDNKP